MDTTLVVFLAGSGVSFFPLLWLLQRRAGLRRAMSLARPAGGPRRRFLDSLRHAAVVKAQRTLEEARAVRLGHDASASSRSGLNERIDESRRTVQALFSADAAARFDRAAAIVLNGAQARGEEAVQLAVQSLGRELPRDSR